VVSVAALLLSDSRFPAGGHAHSGGVEPAVTAGTVTDLASLEAFLRGRLRTAGLVAAGLAAAACARSIGGRRAGENDTALAADDPARERATADGRPAGESNADAALAVDDPAQERATAGGRRAGEGNPGRENSEQRIVHYGGFDFWAELDAEADARTPSPAQRGASRRQGRALLRAARVAWPEDRGLAALAASGAATARATGSGLPAAGLPRSDAIAATASGAGAAGFGASGFGASGFGASGFGASGADAGGEYRGGAHHAVVLGAAAAAAGCDVDDAARIAAYQSVAGAASAAVRLLALDPMRASAVLARLARDIDQIAERAAAAADGPLGELPCPSAPALDLLAEAHIRAEVRLFES
jgi:urease accessory protein